MRLLLAIGLSLLVGCGKADNRDSQRGGKGDRKKTEEGPDDDPGDPNGAANDPIGGKLRMAALGDSITTGLNATGILVESRDLVWSTGDENEKSHYARMLKEVGFDEIEVMNVAVAGATTASLAQQLDDLLHSMKPEYATILIGANDVCSWPVEHAEQLETYESRIEDALDRLIKANPDIKIVLSSVPDMNQLFELKKDFETCRQIWDFAGGCKLLLGRNSTDADRDAFHTRWQDMNEALRRAAAARANNVLYKSEVAEATLEDDHISTIDCFHPSALGQEMIADKTWDVNWARQVVPARGP